MWRNLKISMKLSLGFGFILLVFLVSIIVTWRNIKIVANSSEMLGNRVAPVMNMVSLFNNEVWGVFYSMSSVMYTESPQAKAIYSERLSNALKSKDKITEMYRLYPTLTPPAHVANVIQPISVQYMELADKALALIEKKQALLEGFSQDGVELSEAMRAMVNMLHSQLRNGMQNTGGLGAIRVDIRTIENAMYLSSGILEETMGLQRDAWNAIAIVQAGGGVEKMREIEGKGNDLRKRAEELKPFFITRDEQKILENLLSRFETFGTSLGEFMKACVDLDQLHKARAPLMESLNRETDVALDMALTRVKDVSNENIKYLNDVLFMLFVSTGLAIAFGIIIVVFISRSISKPLNTIVSLAKRAEHGDLTIEKAEFHYEGKDEMGTMVEALAEMVETQNTTMNNIVEIAKDVKNLASDLSSISQKTNAAMEDIRSSVLQVSVLSESNGSALEHSNASVEEMSTGADTVAHSATESAAFIAQTTDASNKAIHTMQSVIEGMHDVDRNSKKSEEKTRQLVSSVENVSSFVSVITGIADQTNLLALNAAIEAARAGEVGRGFAVVAEEVRKLAEESAQAARNVNGIIKELHEGAQESIIATTEAGRLLTSTLENADYALNELNGALDQINKTNDSIQNIAAIAEEQAASSKEAAVAIDSAAKSSVEMIGSMSSINRATDQTALGMKDVAKDVEKMTGDATILSDLLSQFKLTSAAHANSKELAARI